MKKTKKLKNQLTSAFLLILILSFITITVFIFQKTRTIVLNNTEKSRLNSYEQIHKKIEEMNQQINTIASHVYVDANIRDFYTHDYGMDAQGILVRKTIGEFLQRVLTLNSGIQSILIKTDTGNLIGTETSYNYNVRDEIASGRAVSILDSMDADSSLLKYQLNYLTSGIPDTSTDENAYSFRFKKVFRYNQLPVTIYIYVRESYIYDILDQYKDGASESILLCDSSGTVISSYNKGFIGRQKDYRAPDEKGGRDTVRNNRKYQVIDHPIETNGWSILETLKISKYTSEINGLLVSVAIMFVSVILVVILISVLFINKITTPLTVIMKAMANIDCGKTIYHISEKYNNEFGEIVDCFNDMSIRIDTLITNNRLIEQQKTGYAIAALRSQINPHFLFNTINTIKWMAIVQKNNKIKDA